MISTTTINDISTTSTLVDHRPMISQHKWNDIMYDIDTLRAHRPPPESWIVFEDILTLIICGQRPVRRLHRHGPMSRGISGGSSHISADVSSSSEIAGAKSRAGVAGAAGAAQWPELLA